MKTKIMMISFALFGMMILTHAQTPGQSAKLTEPAAKKSCYVDQNNNGSCDLRETGQCAGNPVRQGLRQGPRNGQGIGRTEQGRGLGPCGGRGRR